MRHLFGSHCNPGVLFSAAENFSKSHCGGEEGISGVNAGRTDRWVDGQTGRWMDRRTDVQTKRNYVQKEGIFSFFPFCFCCIHSVVSWMPQTFSLNGRKDKSCLLQQTLSEPKSSHSPFRSRQSSRPVLRLKDDTAYDNFHVKRIHFL